MGQMKSNHSHTKTSILLTGASALGLVFSFFIPVFLSRYLTVEQYGTYKLLVLIQATFFIFAQFGFDAGLFYFVRFDNAHKSLYSINAVLFEIVFTSFICLCFYLFGSRLDQVLHNPDFSRYLLPFSLLLIASISSQHFEHYLLVQGKVFASGLVIVLQEVGKTIAVIGGFYFFRSLEVVFYLMAFVSGLKLLSLCVMNFIDRPHAPFAKQVELFQKQFRYGLPLGFTQLLSLVAKVDRYIVSGLFSVREFAVYSVGCLDIPVISSFGNNLMDLMAFDMIDARKEGDIKKIRHLWVLTKQKIAMLYLPITLFFFIFAEKTMVLLFSKTYAESAIYFRWYLVSFALSVLDSDLIFRAFAKTRPLLLFQILSCFIAVPAMFILASIYGPVGVLVAKAGTDCLIYLAKIHYIYRHCFAEAPAAATV